MKIQFSMRQLLAFSTFIGITCGVVTLYGLEELGMMLILWVFYAGIVIFTTAPIILLTRKQFHWYRWEILALVAPFVIWYALLETNIMPKSLANLCEPFYVAAAVPVAASLRAMLPDSIPNKIGAIGFVVIPCVVAILAYFLVPVLPE